MRKIFIKYNGKIIFSSQDCLNSYQLKSKKVSFLLTFIKSGINLSKKKTLAIGFYMLTISWSLVSLSNASVKIWFSALSLAKNQVIFLFIDFLWEANRACINQRKKKILRSYKNHCTVHLAIMLYLVSYLVLKSWRGKNII